MPFSNNFKGMKLQRNRFFFFFFSFSTMSNFISHSSNIEVVIRQIRGIYSLNINLVILELFPTFEEKKFHLKDMREFYHSSTPSQGNHKKQIFKEIIRSLQHQKRKRSKLRVGQRKLLDKRFPIADNQRNSSLQCFHSIKLSFSNYSHSHPPCRYSPANILLLFFLIKMQLHRLTSPRRFQESYISPFVSTLLLLSTQIEDLQFDPSLVEGDDLSLQPHGHCSDLFVI